MKRLTLIFVLILVSAPYGTALSQFKTQTDEKLRVAESIIRPDTPSSFLGLFDPGRFSMRHSYSFSTMVMSGRNIGIGMYTNSLFYRISDPLDARLDVSLMHSPFSSFNNKFQNNLNKIFINRAELNYRPWENMIIQLQYRQVPYSFYGGFYSPYYYNPFYQGYEFYR